MDEHRLRRSLPLVAGWVLAAVAALAVASWGVALVGNSVTDRRPAPLTAAEVDERLAALPTTTSSTTATSEPTGPTPTSSTPPSDGAATTTSSAPAGPTASTSVPTQSTTTSPPVQSSETRTYAVEGGTVSLRYEPEGVTVVFANPAAGFQVDIEPDHVNGVQVDFESDEHRSRVEGWWDGGPRDRVTEDGRGDSDDSDAD